MDVLAAALSEGHEPWPRIVSDATLPRPAPLPSPPQPAEAHYERCPHCGNSTLVEPSKSLVYKCSVCGKARVPLDRPGYKRSNDEVPALARATAAHTAATAWRAGSIFLVVFAAFGFLSLGLVLTALTLTGVEMFSGALIALLPALLAGYGFMRSSKVAREVAPALDEGWQSVAREVIEQSGTLSDVELAKVLRIDRAHAERLLVQLAATTPVRHRLDEAPLTFESPDADLRADRVRVAGATEVLPGKTELAAATDDELAAAEALEQRAADKRKGDTK